MMTNGVPVLPLDFTRERKEKKSLRFSAIIRGASTGGSPELDFTRHMGRPDHFRLFAQLFHSSRYSIVSSALKDIACNMSTSSHTHSTQ